MLYASEAILYNIVFDVIQFCYKLCVSNCHPRFALLFLAMKTNTSRFIMTWMCCQKIDLSSQNSILMSVNGIYSFQILRKMSTKLSMKLSSWTIKESLGSNKFQKRTRVPPMNLPPKQSQRQMQLLEVSCSFLFSSFHISVGF